MDVGLQINVGKWITSLSPLLYSRNSNHLLLLKANCVNPALKNAACYKGRDTQSAPDPLIRTDPPVASSPIILSDPGHPVAEEKLEYVLPYSQVGQLFQMASMQKHKPSTIADTSTQGWYLLCAQLLHGLIHNVSHVLFYLVQPHCQQLCQRCAVVYRESDLVRKKERQALFNDGSWKMW